MKKLERNILAKYKVITAPFITLEGIQLLMDCGKTKASYYRQDFLKSLNSNGRLPYKNKIPTKAFIEHHLIDLSVIERSILLIKRGNNNESIES